MIEQRISEFAEYVYAEAYEKARAEIINQVLEIIDETMWDDERMQIERAWNHACGTIRLKVLALTEEQE